MRIQMMFCTSPLTPPVTNASRATLSPLDQKLRTEATLRRKRMRVNEAMKEKRMALARGAPAIKEKRTKRALAISVAREQAVSAKEEKKNEGRHNTHFLALCSNRSFSVQNPLHFWTYEVDTRLFRNTLSATELPL